MSSIPCYRAAHLRPYLDFLRDTGAPLERGLRLAGLPTLVAGGADIYLPQHPTFEFIRNMVRQEGIDEFPLRARSKLQFFDLSEQFLARANCAPTLNAALQSFRAMAPVEDADLTFWISYGETTIKMCMSSRLPLNAQDQYFEDWNELLAMLAIVRAFTEPTWQPTAMAFRSTVMPGRYAAEQFPNTRFFTGQKAVWISVPRELLSLPLRVTPDHSRSHAGLAAASPTAVDFQTNHSTSLKAVLSAYLPEQMPGIEFAAEMASTSVRTLQRRLKESDLSYSDLIGEIRFDAAARLLRETDATALEIALEVGYEDPSHFSRAFKRTAGISPRAYRRQQRPHQAGARHNSS